MGTERKKQEESRLYFHGKIFTSDKENLYADAMIVEDGIIRWIGRESKMPEGNCKRYDLEGACVIPGLIDAHMHPMMLADYSRQISALPPEVGSIEELVEKIRERRMRQKPGEWILGWGYDEGKFAEKRSITRYDLDR